MSQQTDFFLARATEEARLADQADLLNVKNGHLRAQAAWTKLAERSARGDALRASDAERKADLAVLEAQQQADAMRGGRE